MFNKATTFGRLPPLRPARSVTAPANDNRRNARPCATHRAPRLVCRWSLSPITGRPVSRWELDQADEPSPRVRGTQLHAAPNRYRNWSLGLTAYGKADAGQHIV